MSNCRGDPADEWILNQCDKWYGVTIKNLNRDKRLPIDAGNQKLEDGSLCVVGVHIHPNTDRDDIFIVINSDNYHAREYPLIDDGYILLFNSFEDAKYAIQNNPVQYPDQPDIEEVSLSIDLVRSLYLLERENYDGFSNILNLLNTTFDLVNAIEYPMPEDSKRRLYAFADHLTFNKEYGAFIDNASISRTRLINDVLWIVGALAASSKICSAGTDR